MKKALSIILCLAMLMSTVPMSVFAAPSAVTVGESASESEGTAELAGESFVVAYDAATGASVTGMPENETAGGTYEVSNVMPQREGYTFEGWTLTPGSSETVKTINVKKDTTLYAKWGKGGYVAEFNNVKEASFGNTGKILFDDNNYLDTSASTHVKDFEYNPEGTGSADMTIAGNDYYFRLTAGSDTAINIDSVKAVVVGLKTPATGTFSCSMFFATKDADGNWIAEFDEANGLVKYVANRFINLGWSLSGNGDEVQEFTVDTSAKPNLWKGFLHHFRLDIENSGSYVGQPISIDYIKLVGNDTVEYIDLDMPAPKASDVAYDASKLSGVSDKFSVKSVTWEGPDLVDGKYFAGDAVYTANVELEAKDGYALSDSPASATINDSEATAECDGEVVKLAYTFPKTETLLDFDLEVGVADEAAPEITVSFGTLQLESYIYTDAGVIIPNEEVYWSIDESQKKYASVDKNGVVTANTDCEALVVTAASKYNPAVKASIAIKITGQIPESNITFAAGTGEEVTNLPEATTAKDEYVLPIDIIPERNGYAFKGWSKELGGEIIKVDDVHEDTTYYAVWGYSKGEEFNGTSDVFTSKSNVATLYEDGSLVAMPNNGTPSEGFMLQAGSGIFGARNRILTDDIEYIEIKTTLEPENLEICVYVQSGTKAGGELTAWNESANKRFYSHANSIANNPDQSVFKYVEQQGEWYIYKLPTKILNNWENYLNQIRFNFVKRDASNANYGWLEFPAGSSYKFDYIRFVGKDIPAMDIVDVSVPEVKGEASAAVTVVQDEAFQVTSVTWTPALLGDSFFGSATEYTVSMQVEVRKGYNSFSNPAARVSVNGNAATYTRKNATSGTITYTFPATEDVGELSLVNITLHESSDVGSATEVKQIFSGDDFDINKLIPANAPTGYRWYGWSYEENGEPITEEVNLSEDADFYALYEIITEFDFSKESHKSDRNVKAENGRVTYDGSWAVITPEYEDSKAKLVLDGMTVSSANYDYVEIIYDGSLEDALNDNKFSETFVPSLTVVGSDDQQYAAALVKTEPVIANNRVAYKYTYDLTVNGKPSTFAKLILAPYTGLPAWGVTSVKFVANTPLEEAVVIRGIREPEAWTTPDTTAVASEGYEIVSITWTPDSELNDNGTFKAETVYTANIVVKPKTGYKITNRSAYYEEELLSGRGVVTLNSNGTLSVKKKFPATAKLVEFDLFVEDAKIDVADGTVTLTPKFEVKNAGETVPITTVKWTIASNGPDGNSASIDENGVVKALYDGDVVVVATSDYNPEISASATVKITNQVPYYTVKFDANTASNVTNMPQDAQVKFAYSLPKSEPVRPGFNFAGWVEKPTDIVPVTNGYITKDTTYYALWVRGFNWEFNDGLPVFDAHQAMSGLKFDADEGTASFTLVGTDPQIYIRTPAGDNYIFNGNDYRVMEARVKTSVSAGFNWGMYFESVDENGNVLGPAYSADSARYVANFSRSVFSTSPDEYTTVRFDLSTKSDWVGGYPTTIRMDLPDDGTSASLGVTYTFDYIRFVNYETSVIEVTGIDAPVAKGVIDTDAVSADTSKYKVTNVTWDGDLLYDYYYNGNTEYTVCVTVKGAPGYFVSDTPTKATVNGKEVTEFDYNHETGEVTLKYTFPATGAISDTTACDITLVSKNDNGEDVYETRTFFRGDSFSIGTYAASGVPSGKRWIGWAEYDGAVENEVDQTIVVNSDKIYYAVYEDMTEFDYGNFYHTVGTKSKSETGTLSFVSDLALMKVESSAADAALVTPSMNILGADFPFVEVYFSKTLESKHGYDTYANRFSSVLKPELKFSTIDAPNDFTPKGTIVGSETVTIDGLLYQKYTYDMTGADSSGKWYGKVASLCVDPYNGYPNWGVRLIKLIPATETSVPANIQITAPETWATPDIADNVSVNDKFEILDISWTPAHETFKPETVYTAKVKFRPAAGFKLVNASATINGEAAAVTPNGDGTYYATYAFDETGALKDVAISIVGSDTISVKGRYLDLKGKTVALDGSKLPVTDVTWKIESVDSDIILANISENGRVYPLSNGKVIVTATSVYDPSVSATHEITITNQADLVKVTFDKNTQAEVEGMPEEVYVYGAFVPENYSITRDGFFFTGWSKDQDALEPDKSFSITEDTVLYAKWGAGYEWSFDNDATSLTKSADKTIIYNNGIATIYPTSSPASQILVNKTNLSSLGLETAKHTTLEIRLSLPIASPVKCYLQSINESGTTSPWAESAAAGSNTISAMPANAAGEFQVVSFDLTSHANWNMYPLVQQVRVDLPTAAPTGRIQIDYVRLLSSERKVKFDGNGGLIPLYGGEVTSYKKTYNIGTISLPANPTREGYKFIGWAKDTEIKQTCASPETYTKLYNGSFTVTDNVTLYAIWVPATSLDDGNVEVSENITARYNSDGSVTFEAAEEAQETLVIKAGDMAVGEKTVVVFEVKDANYASVSNGDTVIEFVDENGNPQSVVLAEGGLSGNVIIKKDLAQYGFTGNVTDVKIVLPTGAIESPLTVMPYVFTTPDVAENIQTEAEKEYPDLKPQSSTVIVADQQLKRDDSTNKYPVLAGGTVAETPAKTTKTPADKKVNVPARPSDDAVVTGGASSTGSSTTAADNSTFPITKKYDGRFTDVSSSNWFYGDVEKSYGLGLMNGKSDTTFIPDGTVTVAEAITVAARMNAIYNKAEIPAAAEGQKWYQPYVDYATKKAIVTSGQYSDYTALATREQVALLFVRALPASWYTEMNLFINIPDVPSTHASYAAIQRLYNAGVITGVDDEYNFKPNDNIKRSEISAIINRVALPASRLRVVTEDEKNNKDKKFGASELGSTLTIGNCAEKEWVIDKDGYPSAVPSKPDPVVGGLQNLMGGALDADEYKTIKVVLTSSQASSMVGQQAQLFFSADGTLSEANSLRAKITKNSDGTLLAQFDGKTNEGWKGSLTTLRFDPWNNTADFSLISITFAP